MSLSGILSLFNKDLDLLYIKMVCFKFGLKMNWFKNYLWDKQLIWNESGLKQSWSKSKVSKVENFRNAKHWKWINVRSVNCWVWCENLDQTSSPGDCHSHANVGNPETPTMMPVRVKILPKAITGSTPDGNLRTSGVSELIDHFSSRGGERDDSVSVCYSFLCQDIIWFFIFQTPIYPSTFFYLNSFTAHHRLYIFGWIILFTSQCTLSYIMSFFPVRRGSYPSYPSHNVIKTFVSNSFSETS